MAARRKKLTKKRFMALVKIIKDDLNGVSPAEKKKRRIKCIKCGMPVSTRINKMCWMCNNDATKIYHDISCNCYDCRLGLSDKAKD